MDWISTRLLSEYDSCPNPKFRQQPAICTIVRTRLMSESGQFGFGQESFSDKSRTRLPDTHKEQFSFPNTLTEQASLQSYKCYSRTRMLDTQLIFRDKIVWLISVMESGLNLDTAIRTGNLAIVSDQYTVHCRPLANAVFGQTSANISNGEWTESRQSYSDIGRLSRYSPPSIKF